jgi:hypothetical protein
MKDNQYLYSEFDATPRYTKDDYISMGIGAIVVAIVGILFIISIV